MGPRRRGWLRCAPEGGDVRLISEGFRRLAALHLGIFIKNYVKRLR